jgi:DNA-binding transcriptional MocR family regulator
MAEAIETLTQRLKARIESGDLRAGARMPSIRTLSEEAGVTRYAVLAAYRALEGMGLVEARHGSGFYVSRFLRGAAPPPTATGLDSLLDTALLIRGFVEPTSLLKCGSGMLPPDWLQDLNLARHVRAVAARPSADLYDYGTALGFAPLREALQGRLARRRITAQPDQILLTTGLSHGFELVLRALCRPGDLVFVENPAYYNLFGLLHLSELRWREIPRTPEGPDLDVLEGLLKKGEVPRLCLLQPLLHNPTGNTMGPAAAHRLLLLAEKYEFRLVEDDAYSDLAEDADLRLAALDGLRRVVYLSGFTKTLSANLRVGCVAASEALIDALARAKLLTSISSSEFAERVVLRVLTDGVYDRLMPLLRQRLAAAQATWEHELARTPWQIFPGARRGMFVWARHPRWLDSVPLAQAAAAAGMWLAPGSAFDPEHRVSPWVRFNVAYRSAGLSGWLKKPGTPQNE